MRHLIQQILLIIICLVFADFSQAMFCYNQTNVSYYNLLAEDGGIFLQETIKDSNKISYIYQEKERLKGINDQGFKVISDDGEYILFLVDAMYYLVPKDLYTVKEIDISPLFREDEVSKIVSNRFFLVSGHWYYVVSENKGKNAKHRIPKLKGNLEIIANFNHGEMLLKDDHAVYIYYEKENTVKKIPHLSPSQTHFVLSRDFNEQHHYLYDDDTFYLTDIRFIYRDITKDFKRKGKYDGFTKAEIHINYPGDSLDTKDGLIWLLYTPTNYQGGENSFFEPVHATYLNKYKDLYVYNDKVYADNWDLINERNPLDLAMVKHPDELHRPLFQDFTDNVLEYLLENNQLRPKEKKNTFRRTTDYIEIQKNRIFIGDTKLSTGIFQNTPIFLGSIVKVIKPCDGDMGNPIVVHVYYFFTDGKKVYAYVNPRINKTPQVLHNVSPKDLKADDYDTLQKLMNRLITP